MLTQSLQSELSMNLLAGLTAGFSLIALSELGDKTFFIGAILAMRYSRRWVFLGVTTALFAMTVLSVLLGQVATLLPPHYVKWAAIALFLGFGGKLLYDASRMSAQSPGLAAEQKEAQELVEETAGLKSSGTIRSILINAFSLTFLAEWGDRTQIATITLAASHNPLGVTIGATLGHALCAAIAVVCGKLIAGRISERWLTAIGGLLFITFGIMTALTT